MSDSLGPHTTPYGEGAFAPDVWMTVTTDPGNGQRWQVNNKPVRDLLDIGDDVLQLGCGARVIGVVAGRDYRPERWRLVLMGEFTGDLANPDGARELPVRCACGHEHVIDRQRVQEAARRLGATGSRKARRVDVEDVFMIHTA